MTAGIVIGFLLAVLGFAATFFGDWKVWTFAILGTVVGALSIALPVYQELSQHADCVCECQP